MEFINTCDNVAICGKLSLDDAIKETLSHVNTTATLNEEDDHIDAAVPVSTFAKVLRNIGSIQRCTCADEAVGGILPDIAGSKESCCCMF